VAKIAMVSYVSFSHLLYNTNQGSLVNFGSLYRVPVEGMEPHPHGSIYLEPDQHKNITRLHNTALHTWIKIAMGYNCTVRKEATFKASKKCQLTPHGNHIYRNNWGTCIVTGGFSHHNHTAKRWADRKREIDPLSTRP
jgi:hypothetical protein